MPRRNLAVDETEFPPFEVTDQVEKGDLGGVRDATEHGLAKKDPSDSHPVQTTRQLTIPIDFYRVSVTQVVQLLIGTGHIGRDPGGFPLLSTGAGIDDTGKVLIS